MLVPRYVSHRRWGGALSCLALLAACAAPHDGRLLDVIRHLEKGEYAEAIRPAEGALERLRSAPGASETDIDRVRHALATVYMYNGRYAEAETLFRECLAFRESRRQPAGDKVAESLNGLGRVYRRMGRYDESDVALSRALAIRRALFQARGGTDSSAGRALADILSNLGILRELQGRLEEAEGLLQEALRVREEVLGADHDEVAQALSNLADFYVGRGRYDDARHRAERALAIWRQTPGTHSAKYATGLHILADLERQQGHYDEAERGYRESLDIRTRVSGPTNPALGWALVELAALQRRKGQYEDAKRTDERTLALTEASVLPEVRWRAVLGLGRSAEHEGRLDEALAMYWSAVRTIEGLAGRTAGPGARAKFLEVEGRLEAYRALAELLLRLHENDPSKGYHALAMAVLDARTGRLIAETLGADPPRLDDAAARSEIEQLQAKQEQVTVLQDALVREQAKPPAEQTPERTEVLATVLAKGKEEYLDYAQTVFSRPEFARYRDLFADQQVVHPEAPAKMAAELPPGVLLVQYFATERKLYVFVVGSGECFGAQPCLLVKTQPVTARELNELIKRYREHLRAGERVFLPWRDDGSDVYRREVAPLKAMTQALSEALLDPIDAELAKHPHLVLIPNDVLRYLPVHALTRKKPDGSTAFLAETHIVSYLTRLEVEGAALRMAEPNPSASLLMLANPDGSLGAAGGSVESVGRARIAMTYLVGPDATKARFLSLAPQFQDVHLATHGVLVSRDPNLSYLRMAGEDLQSRQLTVREIRGKNIPSRLAILSACDAAIPEQEPVPGLALITLATAFSLAGAKSVVASLWRIEDEATRDFMVAFHEALGTVGRAAALQKAQLVLIRDRLTTHPFYWAPFILIGGR